MVEFEIESSEHYLLVIARGELSGVADIVDYTLSMAEAVIASAPQRVLLDHRKITGPQDLYISYEVVRNAEELNSMMKMVRWAVVANPDRIEHARLFETIARNRGFSLLVFETIEEAEEWLLA